MLFQRAVRIVKSGQLCLMAFGIGFFSDFPMTISNGGLNGGDCFHSDGSFLHIASDRSSFFIHTLQGVVQILQREKLMLLQIWEMAFISSVVPFWRPYLDHSLRSAFRRFRYSFKRLARSGEAVSFSALFSVMTSLISTSVFISLSK